MTGRRQCIWCDLDGPALCPDHSWRQPLVRAATAFAVIVVADLVAFFIVYLALIGIR